MQPDWLQFNQIILLVALLSCGSSSDLKRKCEALFELFLCKFTQHLFVHLQLHLNVNPFHPTLRCFPLLCPFSVLHFSLTFNSLFIKASHSCSCRIFIIWAISSWFRRGPSTPDPNTPAGAPRVPSRNLFPKDTLMVLHLSPLISTHSFIYMASCNFFNWIEAVHSWTLS